MTLPHNGAADKDAPGRPMGDINSEGGGDYSWMMHEPILDGQYWMCSGRSTCRKGSSRYETLAALPLMGMRRDQKRYLSTSWRTMSHRLR